jgi:hypothetical protein
LPPIVYKREKLLLREVLLYDDGHCNKIALPEYIRNRSNLIDRLRLSHLAVLDSIYICITRIARVRCSVVHLPRTQDVLP